MKLIIEIPEEYYNCIKEIPVNTSTADMLIIRNGIPMDQCGDCISREAVENAIKHAEVNFTVNSDIDFTKHKREVQEIVNGIIDAQIKALRDLPSVTPMQKWIPCSERLPEIHQDVILSLRSLDIEVGFRAETEPYFYCHGADGRYIDPKNVLAWMPLPLPYKQEVEE